MKNTSPQTYEKKPCRADLSQDILPQYQRTFSSPQGEFHFHEDYELFLFLDGKADIFVEQSRYMLERGSLLAFHSSEVHRAAPDPSLPYERIIVYMSSGFIDAYRTDDYDLSYCFEKAKKEHSNVLRIHSLEKSSLFKITNRLERSFSDTEYAGSLYRQILFLEFMIHLNRAAIKNRVEFLDTSLYNPKIVDLIQYINQHLTESLDVDFLSSRVYLSKYYMMRLFKAETGYTIGNYITYRRLLLARTLILDGMPITQACLASGFQDYSTFSRAYKTEFHEPPRTLLHHSD